MLHSGSIQPNANALAQLATHIWEFTLKENKRVQVVMSSGGAVFSLRQELEKQRPSQLPPHLVFLPRILGLTQWLSFAPGLELFPRERSLVERLEIIYHHLVQFEGIQKYLGVIGEGGLWALAQSVLLACDELSNANLDFERFNSNQNQDAHQHAEMIFEGLLKKTYPQKLQELLQIDAQLITHLWRFTSTVDDPVARRRLSYQLYEQDIQAEQSLPPLVWVELSQYIGTEKKIQERYLQGYAKHHEVMKVDIDWQVGALWPECASEDQTIDTHVIQNNRQQLKSKSIHLIGMKSFEQTAIAAASRIEQYFIEGQKEGHKKVALVAQDRLLARRVRAIIARLGDGVSVRDSTGWKLSTTSVAAAVHSWIDVIRSPQGPSVEELLKFLKNPLIRWQALLKGLDSLNSSGSTDVQVVDLVWQIEQRLRATEVSGSWVDIVIALEGRLKTNSASRGDGWSAKLPPLNIALQLILVLKKLSEEWHLSNRHGAAWSALFIAQLKLLTMWERLEADPAGNQMIEQINAMQVMIQTLISKNSWVSLFELLIEDGSYIESSRLALFQLEILPLSALRLRHFDAVIMVGCDDKQFPNFSESTMFFSSSLIQSLGMKGVEEEYRQQARDFSQLLLTYPHIDLFWQTLGNGQEVQRPSSFITRLGRDFPELKSQEIDLPKQSLITQSIGMSSASWDIRSYPLPEKISPSGYKTLRECPYKFYVSRLLKVSAPKGFGEKNEYGMMGEVLHETMGQFFNEYKTIAVQGNKKEWMVQRLTEISQQFWQPLIAMSGKNLTYFQDWLNYIPKLIDWQLKREHSGWFFNHSEQWVSFELSLGEDLKVVIEGRADRFDVSEKSNEAEVIDYKFQSADKFKHKSKYVDDDPQLLIYAIAANQKPLVNGLTIHRGLWVSLKDDGKENKDQEFPINITSGTLKDLQDSMNKSIGAIWQGEAMKATGPESVCQYCEVRGLCRKGMWTND